MSLLKRLEAVDRRIAWGLAIFVMMLALLAPMGLPVTVSDRVRHAYEIVEAIPDGARILVSNENGLADYRIPETFPGYVAIINHIFRSVPDVKFFFISTGAPDDNDLLVDFLIRTGDFPFKDKAYGVDYVNIGWIPGLEAGLQAWAANPLGYKPYDFLRRDITNMPIMALIKSAADFNFWVTSSRELSDLEMSIRQIGVVYGLKPLMVGPTSMIGQFSTYVNAGQAVELIYGARLAAEYEKLIRRPGNGLATMDAQTLLAIVTISFLAIGNIPIIAAKPWKKAETAGKSGGKT